MVLIDSIFLQAHVDSRIIFQRNRLDDESHSYFYQWLRHFRIIVRSVRHASCANLICDKRFLQISKMPTILDPVSLKPVLWRFLLTLLQNSEFRFVIVWLDIEQRTFQIIHRCSLVDLWAKLKNRPILAIDTDNFFRSLRHYYRSGHLKKLNNILGGYQFLPNAQL